MAEYIKGMTIEDAIGKMNRIFPRNKEVMRYQEALVFEMTDGQLTFLDLLNDTARQGVSMRQLSQQLHIKGNLLPRLCQIAGIPTLSQAEATRIVLTKRWQDPELRGRIIEGSRLATVQRWQDPDYRKAMNGNMRRLNEDPEFTERRIKGVRVNLAKQWKDPEYKKAQSERMRKLNEDPKLRKNRAKANSIRLKSLWLDPEYRQRKAEEARALLASWWQDQGFRERHAERTRAALSIRWQDPQYREMMVAVSRIKWEDPDFRQRNHEALMRARLAVGNQGRYPLISIHGKRRDIGYAKSAWEANIRRVFIYIGREVLTNEALRLSDGSQFEIDFVTAKADGSFKLYEIMAHPFEDPDGWDKLNLAQSEFPELSITPITGRMYRRIARRFRTRINADPNFCGWEGENDNLRDNPEKYAPTG